MMGSVIARFWERSNTFSYKSMVIASSLYAISAHERFRRDALLPDSGAHLNIDYI